MVAGWPFRLFYVAFLSALHLFACSIWLPCYYAIPAVRIILTVVFVDRVMSSVAPACGIRPRHYLCYNNQEALQPRAPDVQGLPRDPAHLPEGTKRYSSDNIKHEDQNGLCFRGARERATMAVAC